MSQCEDCIKQGLEIRVKTLESEVNELKTKQVVMGESNAEIKAHLSYIKTSIETMTSEIKELSKLPATRWNNLVTTVITSGIIGALSFIAGKMIK